MKCPVCKTELVDGTKRCPTCGFNDIRSEFINAEDAANWMDNVVIPFRSSNNRLQQQEDPTQLYNRLISAQKSSFNNIELSSDFDYIISDDGICLTSYKGLGGNVVCPDNINGINVYKLGEAIFKGCQINQVTLPNYVEIIADNALYGTNISSIIIPGSCSHIGESAFEKTKLGDVIIPHNCISISKKAFAGTNIRNIVFPSNIKVIEESVCENCKYLETIVLLGAEEIGSFAFRWNASLSCGKVNAKIILPETMKSLKFGALSGISKPVILPKSVECVFFNVIFSSIPGYSNISIPDIAFPNDNVQFIEEKVRGGESSIWSFHYFYCNPGSTAQKYAREHNIMTKPLSEFPVD